MASTKLTQDPEHHEMPDKTVAWYMEDADVPDLEPGACELLMRYSHLAQSEIRPHVLKIRDQAWRVFPFPCIGQMRFLDLSLASMPSYPRLLSRLKDDDAEPCDVPPVKLIDVGCGFGQDLRKLVYDGVASERLIGLDIRNDFLELGYELFLDRATFTGKFIAANVFDHSVDSPVQSIQSQMDVVHAASFLHLFGWDEQIQACRGLSQLLKNEPGTMILGRHIGSRESGEYPHKTNPSGVTFSHDPTTFETMWRDVSRRTNTEWQVSATFENDLDPTNADKRNWKGGKFEWLYFEVTRL